MNRSKTLVKLIASILAFVMVFGAFAPINDLFGKTLAEKIVDEQTGEITYGVDDGTVVLNKDAWLNDDGTYNIDLTAYITGNPKVITHDIPVPTDFVLVVDQSNSMTDVWTCNGPTSCNVCTANNLFVDNSGKLTAVKNASLALIDALREQSTDDYYHRVAIVGFGGQSNDGRCATGLFDNNAVWHNYRTNYDSSMAQNFYANTFNSVYSAQGYNTLMSDINQLSCDGGTHTHYGMEMAKGILNATKNDTYQLPDGSTALRQKIVIVFSDGAPGVWGFDMDFAAKAINYATEIKADLNAKIYAVTLTSLVNEEHISSWDGNGYIAYVGYVGDPNSSVIANAVPVHRSNFDPTKGYALYFKQAAYNALHLDGEFLSRDFNILLSSAYPCTGTGSDGRITAVYGAAPESAYWPTYNVNGYASNTWWIRPNHISYYYKQGNTNKLITGQYAYQMWNYSKSQNPYYPYNNHPTTKIQNPENAKYYYCIENAFDYHGYSPSVPNENLQNLVAAFTEIAATHWTEVIPEATASVTDAAFIKDIISANFDIPADFTVSNNVKVYTQNAVGYSNGKFVFGNPVEVSNPAVTLDGTAISVGFDFKTNTCLNLDNSVTGKRLVVRISGLLAKSDKTGILPTNHPLSGLYSSPSSNVPSVIFSNGGSSGDNGGNSGSQEASPIVSASLMDVVVWEGASKMPTLAVTPFNTDYTVLSWSAGDSTIATVNPTSGKVTGVKGGFTTPLTATIRDNATNQTLTVNSTITVLRASDNGGGSGGSTNSSPIVSVEVTGNMIIPYGGRKLPVVTITPGNTDYTITWTIANPAIATVDADGIVTGNRIGSTTLTGVLHDNVTNGNYTLPTISVSVADSRYFPAISSATLADMVMPVGASKLPDLQIDPANTDYFISWTIANPAIATVNSSGKVTGVTPGVTTLTAQIFDNRATTNYIRTVSSTVTVYDNVSSGGGSSNDDKPSAVLNAILSPITVWEGSSKLTSLYVFPDDSDYTIERWEIADTSIATIDGNGRVTGVIGDRTTSHTATIRDNSNGNIIYATAPVYVLTKNSGSSGGSSGGNNGGGTIAGESLLFPEPTVRIREKEMVYDFSLVIKDDNAEKFFADTLPDGVSKHDVADVITLDDPYAKQTKSGSSYNYHNSYPYDNAKHADLFDHFDVRIADSINGNSHAEVVIKSINGEKYELAAMLRLTDEFKRTDIVTGQKVTAYEWCRISFLPATNVHYEESLFNYTDAQTKGVNEAKWTSVGQPNGETYDAKSGELLAAPKYGDAHQDATHNTATGIYGHDEEYHNGYADKTRETHGDSNGRAMMVKVDQQLADAVSAKTASWPMVEFNFRGTAIDFISRSGVDTGAFSIDIVPTNKGWGYTGANMSAHMVVDTYYSNGTFYQIPVLRVEGLEWLEQGYKCRIRAVYSSYMDHQLKGFYPTKSAPSIPGLEEGVEYELVYACENAIGGPTRSGGGSFTSYVDAIRVYNPHTAAVSASDMDGHIYTKHEEHNPDYSTVRSRLIEAGSFGGDDDAIDGVVYIDQFTGDKVTIDDYAKLGPNNEAYLRPGNGIAFTVKEFDYGTTRLHLSAKSPNAKAVVMSINNDKYTIDSATELFFDVTASVSENGHVVILCDDVGGQSDAVLSLCQIKVVSDVPTRSACRYYVDGNTINYADGVYSENAAPISSPLNLRASFEGFKPSLVWSSVYGASYYEIWRALDNGEYTFVDTVTTPAFVDNSSLTALSTYNYKVRAISIYGVQSEFSAPISVVAYGLAAPNGVSVKIVDNKAVLTWNAVTHATAYEIYRMNAAGEYAYLGTSTGTTYTDSTELTAGVTNSYKVRALDNYGNVGEFSVNVNAGMLSAPTGVKGKMSGGTPYLTWNAVAGAAKYEIYRSVGGSEYTLIGSTTKKYYSDKTFANGTTYSYKLKAVNGSNVSPLSSAVKVATPPSELDAPTGVKGKMSGGTPYLTWNAVTNATKYEIWRSTDGVNYTRIATTTKRYYSDANFQTGYTYYYKIKALNSVGASPLSAAVSVATPVPNLATPTGVKGKMSGGAPYLTWNAVTGATKYEIWRSTDGVNFTSIGSTTKKYYSDKSFESGVTYYYKIKALNTIAESPLSAAVTVKTP